MSQQDMDRQDGVFAAALGYQLASEDIDLLLWLHAEAVHEKDVAYRLLEQVNRSAMQAVDEARGQVGAVHVLRDAAEASRRDWAAEALRLDMVEEAKHCTGARWCAADVHHEGCSYSDTGLCCDEPRPTVDAGEPDENVTTCGNCGEDMDADMLERLRYSPLGSLPLCAVHPEVER